MLDRLDETIVAISTAPGPGPLGIVRLSGDDAIALADRMARTNSGRPLASLAPSTRITGEVFIDEGLGLPAEFYVFKAPRSYTRQDIVETHTVGSPAALEMIRQRAIQLGALPAQPGEFTARAFLNGAMDLAEAEAVAGVIRARSDTQLRASRRVMDGALSRDIRGARETLSELVALVEADIDFAEEPIDFISPQQLRDRLQKIAGILAPMLTDSASAERFDVLPRILLLGPPNSGKSTLMNCLSGTSRAICAAVAGTTRDVLSAPIQLAGGEAILLDAAGVDETTDEVLGAARAATLATAEQVDVVCVVVDVAGAIDDRLLETVKSLDVGSAVIAANKSDLVSKEAAGQGVERLESCCLGPVCLVSALQRTGIDELRTALGNLLGSTVGTTLADAVLLNERQRSAISEAAGAIGRAIELASHAAETIDCADLLAFELREALASLGAVVGEVTTDDLLDRVFADFCIGK